MHSVNTEFNIDNALQSLARKIESDHISSKNSLPLVMICMADEALTFFNELLKNLNLDREIDYINADINENDEIYFTKDLTVDLKGKRVYVVTDVIDSNRIALEILLKISDRIPADVKFITLYNHTNTTMPIDYYCCDTDDLVDITAKTINLSKNYKHIFKK